MLYFIIFINIYDKNILENDRRIHFVWFLNWTIKIREKQLCS